MPIYDYRCDLNEQVVEVTHRMSEMMNTWGELCDKATIDCGDTPRDSAVIRVITRSAVNTRAEVITLENILPK